MSDEKEIFDCKQCGHCCHGETTVSLNQDDLNRLADYLGVDVETMKEKYLRVTGNVIQMKIVDGHCIFYKQGCTIHPGKPWRCGQWPLHPSILTDPNNFSAIKASCPGLNATMEYDAFCERLDRVLKEKEKNNG